MKDIENVIIQLMGIEQICLNLSASDYTREAGEAEMFLLFSDTIQEVREKLMKYIEKRK